MPRSSARMKTMFGFSARTQRRRGTAGRGKCESWLGDAETAPGREFLAMPYFAPRGNAEAWSAVHSAGGQIFDCESRATAVSLEWGIARRLPKPRRPGLLSSVFSACFMKALLAALPLLAAVPVHAVLVTFDTSADMALFTEGRRHSRCKLEPQHFRRRRHAGRLGHRRYRCRAVQLQRRYLRSQHRHWTVSLFLNGQTLYGRLTNSTLGSVGFLTDISGDFRLRARIWVSSSGSTMPPTTNFALMFTISRARPRSGQRQRRAATSIWCNDELVQAHLHRLQDRCQHLRLHRELRPLRDRRRIRTHPCGDVSHRHAEQ